MRKSLVIFLVAMALLLLGVSAAISTLWKLVGWLTIPILLVGLIVSGFIIKKLAVRAFHKVIQAPFRMKGAALKNASAEVHEVVTLSENDGRRQIRIDFTIIPDPSSQSTFASWDMTEVCLVPHGTTDMANYDSDEDGYDVTSIELFQDGEFRTYECETVNGPTRARFEASVPLDARRISFSYYFEVFGDFRVELPRIASTA